MLYALQSAYSSDVAALEQVVFFYVPFALLFALLRDLDWTPRRLLLCLGVLVALALAFAAVGFVEYQTRELLLNPKVIASNQVEEYFRVNSLFFDPNIYGRFLALVMLCLSALLLWGRRTRDIALAVAALVVLWGGLVLTLSQSSFAALLAGLLVLAALRFPGRRTLAAAGAVVAVGAIVVLAFPGALRLDLGSSKSIDKATSGRFDLMRGGLELARERPLAGWGSGSFQREYRRRQNTSSERAVSASHTIPITVAAEQGLIGLAVYLALLAAALGRLLRSPTGTRAVIAAGFTALVLHTWLYASFLEDPMTWTLSSLPGVGVASARSARKAALFRGHARDPRGAPAVGRGRRGPSALKLGRHAVGAPRTCQRLLLPPRLGPRAVTGVYFRTYRAASPPSTRSTWPLVRCCRCSGRAGTALSCSSACSPRRRWCSAPTALAAWCSASGQGCWRARSSVPAPPSCSTPRAPTSTRRSWRSWCGPPSLRRRVAQRRRADGD